jgi:3-oxoacyl-[acyl-carrier-protein] synthase II
LSAAGISLEQNMASLFASERHVAPPIRFSADHPGSYPVFEIIEDPTLPIKLKNEDISRTSRLGLAATMEALEDAGLSHEKLKGLRVGVCIGTTVGSAMNNEGFYRDFRSGLNPDMAIINRFLNSNPASVIAREFDLTGPCQTVVNACASGTDAIGIGASWLRSGICDMVITGGADELCRVTYNGFISLMVSDSSPCRPFDRDRRGLNLGEGAAVLILEPEEVMRARDKAPKAFVMGYGTACDGYHITAPAPDGRGLKKALKDALEEGGMSSSDIAFVNAHGTATRDNDKTEARVLNEILPGVPYHSTKGYTGHTLGAAGAIEAAFTVACLEAEKIPANAGFNEPDPELTTVPVTENMEISKKVAISESLAFGGHNAVLVLGVEK